MPKTPDVFGPISAEATVASNTATVTFQAVGGAKRITNLFANVSTSVLQASCSLYVGVVSNLKRVYTSQSGSTGFNARGNIDLQDGEILYVVWTGADNGATAYATFTGHNINFADIGASTITGEDPIAAGDGSLIFPAIKSPNYVAGVSGWKISRDGDIEMNDGTFRGELLVTDVDGTYVKIFDEDPGDGAVIEMTNSRLRSGTSPNTGFQGLLIQGPDVGTLRPGVEFVQNNFGASDAWMFADNVHLSSNAAVDVNANFTIFENDGGRGTVSSGGMNASSGAIGNTETNLFTCSSFDFKAGRAYRLTAVGMDTVSVAGNRPLFRLRKSSGGTQILAKSIYNGVAGAQNVADWAGYFYVSGSDVTCSPVVSVIGSAAFTVTVLGPYGVTIEDVGESSRVSGWAFQLT